MILIEKTQEGKINFKLRSIGTTTNSGFAQCLIWGGQKVN
jgi:hypothetical protein